MADQRLRSWVPKAVIGAILLAVALVAARVGYDRYSESYAIERRDDGQAVTRVVAARFARASALKVGSLDGTVQSSAADTRAFGMLTSDKLVKAPFYVDYFIDVSRLSGAAYRWDQATNTLTIDVPDIQAGRVNVDEAAQTVNRTRGLFVTRAAADQLAQRVARNAQRAASAEAMKPEHVAAARENARRALGDLVAGPLEAAGLRDVRVQVRFPHERSGSRDEWDRSRSVGEVIGNGG